MEFFMNDLTSDVVNAQSISGDQTAVFTIPVGYEFVGVRGRSASAGWADFKVYITCATPSNSGITFDLSNIDGKFQLVTAGATVQLAFSVTDATGGACGALVYSVSVTPALTTGSLISIPNASSASVQFLASSNIADINQYTVTVSAYYSGSISACPASASATYSYVMAGCPTATITPNNYGSITAQVGSPGNYGFNHWRDSVSVNSGSCGLKCGAINYITNIISAPSTYDHASMGGMITYPTVLTNCPPDTRITVAPTLVEQIGIYSITTKACLALFPSICGTSTSQTITVQPCQVTSIQVVQQSDELALSNQGYSVPSTASFSYQFKAILIPACGYTTTGWTVATSSTNNPTNTASYNSVSPAGLFSSGPFPDSSTAGDYYLTINSVTVSVVGVDTVVNAIATTPTNAFLLKVSDGCADAVITATTPTTFSLKVFDPVQAYGAFAAFVYTSTAGSLMCGVVKYSVVVQLGTSSNAITTLTVDSTLRNFQVFSGNLNQIGTYTVTLIGSLPAPHTSIQRQTTFIVEVVNPCLTTTLAWATSMSAMSTSVRVLDTNGLNLLATQKAPSINDAVSSSQGTTGLCAGFTFTISDTPASGVTALSSSELTINQADQIISVWTSQALTVGVHTVTVTAYLTLYYTSVTASVQFELTIKPCIVTSFQMSPLSPDFDYSYIIAEKAFTFSVLVTVATQIPACGYTVSLSSITKPNYVTATPVVGSIQFSSYSREVQDAGVHSISVDATISNYPYTVSPVSSSSFVSTAVDPCYSSTFQITKPTKVESMAAFAGYFVTSKFDYLFNDTASELYTWPTDPVDFCGPKRFYFTLNSSYTTQLTGQNGGKITLRPDSTNTALGESTANLYGYLQNYKSVVSQPISFLVTVLQSVPPEIGAQTYLVGNEPLLISLDPFEVLPMGFASTLTGSLSLFLIADGYQLPERLASNQSGLTPVSQLGWISLLQESMQIQVQTSSTSSAGTYWLVLVQSYDQHPQVRPFTQFKLRVNPKYVYVNQNYLIGVANTRLNLFANLGIELVDTFSVELQLSQLTGLPVRSLGVVNNQSPVASLAISVTDKSFANTNATFQVTAKSTLLSTLQYPTLILNLKFFLPPTETETQEISIIDSNKIQNFTIAQTASKGALSAFNRLKTVSPYSENGNLIFLAEEFAKIVNVTWFQKQLKDPDAFLGAVTHKGEFQVQFNHQMFTFPPPLAQNATLFNKSLKAEQPILQITIVPGRFSNPANLNFSYNITEFAHKAISIELIFEHPELVSSQSPPDLLKIEFVGNFYFFDFKGRVIPEWKTISRPMPRQLGNDTTSVALDKYFQKIKQSAYSLVYGSLILNFFLRAALSQILSMINTQQLIVIMPLFDINLPANAALFFGFLTNLASFNMVPTDTFYDYVFPQLKNADPGPVNENFEALGYGSTFFLYNIGSLILAIITIPGLVAASAILWLISHFSNSILRIHRYLSRNLYWGHFLSLLFESYSALVMGVLINLTHVTFDSVGEIVNSAFFIFFAVVCFASPLLIAVVMLTKFKRLDIASVKKSIGQLYEELHLDRGRSVIAIPTTFLARRLLMTMSVIFSKSIVVQIFTTFGFSVAQFSILGQSPYNEVSQTKNELLNESFILLTLYSFFCFTEVVSDPQIRYQAGFFVSSIVTLHLAANLVWIFSLSGKKIVLLLKRLYVRFKRGRRETRKIIQDGGAKSQLKDPFAENQFRRKQLLEVATKNLETRKQTLPLSENLKQKRTYPAQDREEPDQSELIVDPPAIEQDRIKRSRLIWDEFESEEKTLANEIGKQIEVQRTKIFLSHGIVPISSAAQNQLDEIKAEQEKLRRNMREAGLEDTRAFVTQSQRSVIEIEQLLPYKRRVITEK